MCTLGTYVGEPFKIFGYFNACIELGSKCFDDKVYIYKKGGDLIGWPHQTLLGVSLNLNANPQVQLQQVVPHKADVDNLNCYLLMSSQGCGI